MTIRVLFDFLQKLIFLLGVTAFALAFMFMYTTESKRRSK